MSISDARSFIEVPRKLYCNSNLRISSQKAVKSAKIDSKLIFLLTFFALVFMVVFMSGNNCCTSRTVTESAESIEANSAAGCRYNCHDCSPHF